MSKYPGIIENMYYFTKTFLTKFEETLESFRLKKTYKTLWVGIGGRGFNQTSLYVSMNLQVFLLTFSMVSNFCSSTCYIKN